MALGNIDVVLRKFRSSKLGDLKKLGVALKVGEKAAKHLTPLHAPVYEGSFFVEFS